MHGVPEVHKSGLPILSTVNSHNSRLSKYLVELLRLFTVSSFSVKDSFTFTSEIGKLRSCNYSRATFNIVFFFTNIPFGETIEIVLNKIYFVYDDQS